MFNLNPEDRINNVVKAIAFAEGCIFKDESYNKFSLPYRLNNPCDLKIAPNEYHGISNGTGKLVFPDIGTGWNAGFHQVWLMATDKSHVYNKDMTFLSIAHLYAAESHKTKELTAADNWAKNVCLFLNITTDVTLDQYLHPIFETLHNEIKQVSPPDVNLAPITSTPVKTRLFGK